MNNVTVHQGTIATVMINRPEVRNALNSETIEELLATFSHLASDPEVEVVILTAAGERAFCAGADLAEVGRITTMEEARAYFGKMAQLIAAIEQMPQPVIGAVFGYTLAGGMGLAAAVDLLVAAEDTQFGLPEVKVGLYPMVVTAPITRLIGARRTLELGLTGRIINAETAESWGLINRLVPKEHLNQTAQEMASEIRSGSTIIAKLGKEGWRLAQSGTVDEAMENLRNLVALVALSEDSREGVSAFLEKRAPQWPSRTKVYKGG